MKEKIKKTILAIFRFILFILVAIGIFIVLDNYYLDAAQTTFVFLSILSAFILGILYKKDIFDYKRTD